MRADLALVGFGNVGRRFARLLDERRQRLARDHDLEYRIVGIATRRHGVAASRSGLDATAAAAAIESGDAMTQVSSADARDSFDVIRHLAQGDAELKVVVETTTLDIAAGQPAISHVQEALDAGCHVVTANKGPVAFDYHALQTRADQRGRHFLFEGAVMDGIPIFNLARETMPAIDVLGFRGVVNSTTNHILTALEDGEEFGPALARMQAEGIAEADPTLDVDGWDAAAKAAALANVLLGARLTPRSVDREGIDAASAHRAQTAIASGRRLRLVASGARTNDGQVTVAVRLTELPASDLLAGLRGTANALILKTDLLGELAICQLGGDLTQTAYALLSDLITVARRHRAPHAAPPRRSL